MNIMEFIMKVSVANNLEYGYSDFFVGGDLGYTFESIDNVQLGIDECLDETIFQINT